MQIISNIQLYEETSSDRAHTRNLADRVRRLEVEFDPIWTKKVPPKGPLALLLETFTWQRLEIPLTVPEQVVPSGIATLKD